MKHLIPIFTLALLQASSCTSQKKLAYLSNLPETDGEETFTMEIPDYRIQPKDIFYITVKAMPPDGTINDFLTSTRSSGGSNNSMSESGGSLYGYDVNSKGKKVLLIGLDLRKPRINKVFEFEDSLGMSTFLSGNCNYEEIIKKTQIDNLYYALSWPIPPNPAELFETYQMKKFMERAKKEFDYVIIDTPPVTIVTDVILLAQHVDVNLFIVRQRYTSRYTLDLIEQLNKHGELKNMSIVINDISLPGYYGYGMRYGYAQGYGYSYWFNYYGSNNYGRYGYKDKTKGYYTKE